MFEIFLNNFKKLNINHLYKLYCLSDKNIQSQSDNNNSNESLLSNISEGKLLNKKKKRGKRSGKKVREYFARKNQSKVYRSHYCSIKNNITTFTHSRISTNKVFTSEELKINNNTQLSEENKFETEDTIWSKRISTSNIKNFIKSIFLNIFYIREESPDTTKKLKKFFLGSNCNKKKFFKYIDYYIDSDIGEEIQPSVLLSDIDFQKTLMYKILEEKIWNNLIKDLLVNDDFHDSFSQNFDSYNESFNLNNSKKLKKMKYLNFIIKSYYSKIFSNITLGIIKYFLTCFLYSVLKNSFYITQGQGEGKKIGYFLSSTWESILKENYKDVFYSSLNKNNQFLPVINFFMINF